VGERGSGEGDRERRALVGREIERDEIGERERERERGEWWLRERGGGERGRGGKRDC
jgi:hypothetical protein